MNPPPIQTRSRTILVIDDDWQVVSLATAVAKSAGHIVHGFTHPKKAMEFMDSNRFDLALVDLMMPEKDGLDVTKWILENHPYARVINMTGHAPVLTLLGCWRLGSDACVLKGAEFIPLLKEAIDGSLRALAQWEKSIATVRASSRITRREGNEQPSPEMLPEPAGNVETDA